MTALEWFEPHGPARRLSRRLPQVVITLFGLLILTFVIGRVMPIDPRPCWTLNPCASASSTADASPRRCASASRSGSLHYILMKFPAGRASVS